MDACIICSEKDRMERLESKIDRLCESMTDIKVSLGRLDGTRDTLIAHEKSITRLEAAQRSNKVFWSYVIAIGALAVNFLPWLTTLLQSNKTPGG